MPTFLAGAWQDEQTGGRFPTMLDEFTGTDVFHAHVYNGAHADSLGPASLLAASELLNVYVADRDPIFDPALRVVTAEEVFEADIPLPNVASMQTRAARADRPEVDLRRLVAGFLRMAPDVAIVGEVRDREALPLLLTLSSGVKGFTTIHAGSARQALTRLRFICQLSDTSNELPMNALNNLVSEAIDVVVHCVRTPDGPRVGSIVCVEDSSTGADATAFTATDVFVRDPLSDTLTWSGDVPVRANQAFADAGIDLRSVLGVGDGA